MASRAIASTMLVLRIFTLAASAATIALVVTNNVELIYGTKILKFKDYNTYWYVISVAAVAAAYTVFQLPFAFYYAIKQKRLIRDGYLTELDFYGDKVISLVLATGVGAGLAFSVEFKKLFNDSFDDAEIPKDDIIRSIFNKFYDRGIIAAAVLSAALLCMALVSVLSSINRTNTSKGFLG